MKTPWHRLLQHGTAITALLVISISALLLMAVVGIGIILTKLAVLVR